ncbi:TetR/AcrR family transcriptional regulator [Aquihabitans daechungensis]|uniref:TetR/AcrR family transcriptional regulator n=1 Tax=Aquihabitans daechungensis TaxID=1052257 RepID=UPI003BA048D4
MDRILETGQALLDGRRFTDVSVNEICIAADVSLSSFYARFDSKERLLAVLHEQHVARRREQIGAVLAELLAPQPSLRTFLTQAATIYLAAHELDRPMVQTLRQEHLANPGLAARLEELNVEFRAAVTDAAMSLVPDADADLRRRARFATHVVSLALRESVHSAVPLLPNAPVADERIVDEVIDLWMLYVFSGHPPDRGPSA